MKHNLKCPGQDQRFWKPEDIFNVRCPNCGNEIEFWKDDPFRSCQKCEKKVLNPRLEIGCAEWCKHSKDCIVGELISKE